MTKKLPNTQSKKTQKKVLSSNRHEKKDPKGSISVIDIPVNVLDDGSIVPDPQNKPTTVFSTEWGESDGHSFQKEQALRRMKGVNFNPGNTPTALLMSIQQDMKLARKGSHETRMLRDKEQSIKKHIGEMRKDNPILKDVPFTLIKQVVNKFSDWKDKISEVLRLNSTIYLIKKNLTKLVS